MSGKITAGFRDIIELTWSEFVQLEKDPNQSNFDAVVATLVRACVKGNMRAIQMALDRLDGKVAMEIEVEYPQFYTLYPQATMTASSPDILEADEDGVVELVSQEVHVVVTVDEPDEMPTGSLRAVLDRMLEAPKQTVTDILDTVQLIDIGKNKFAGPHVKSVLMAGLMKMVHDGRIGAIFEVLDQIDGKVADKYKVLGSDVFMYNYAEVAPAGAEKNDDGIYQISADNTTNSWVARLEEKNARKNNR
jgi:hypothetical protein